MGDTKIWIFLYLKENANILQNILNIVKKFDNIETSYNFVYGPAVIAYICR